MEEQVDFAFETTLATVSYVSLIKEARAKGYTIELVFFWLDSPAQAMKRVAKRVSGGGHNIPDEVVVRRYHRGLHNLMHLYIPCCDKWTIVNMTDLVPETIAKDDGVWKSNLQ